MKQHPRRLWRILSNLVRQNLVDFASERQPLVWVTSLIVGLLAASASVAFRVGINAAQLPWLGTMSEHVASAARSIPWPVVLLAPAVGGLGEEPVEYPSKELEEILGRTLGVPLFQLRGRAALLPLFGLRACKRKESCNGR